MKLKSEYWFRLYIFVFVGQYHQFVSAEFKRFSKSSIDNSVASDDFNFDADMRASKLIAADLHSAPSPEWAKLQNTLPDVLPFLPQNI